MRYRQAADEVREAIVAKFWDQERGYLLRMLTVDDEGKRLTVRTEVGGIWSHASLVGAIASHLEAYGRLS